MADDDPCFRVMVAVHGSLCSCGDPGRHFQPPTEGQRCGQDTTGGDGRDGGDGFGGGNHGGESPTDSALAALDYHVDFDVKLEDDPER